MNLSTQNLVSIRYVLAAVAAFALLLSIIPASEVVAGNGQSSQIAYCEAKGGMNDFQYKLDTKNKNALKNASYSEGMPQHHIVPAFDGFDGHNLSTTYDTTEGPKTGQEILDAECDVTLVFQPETFTLTATKLVCEDVSELPHWSGSGTVIDADTASEYADSHDCEVTDWQFQWAPGGVTTTNEEDNSGELNGWNTFSGSVVLDIDDFSRISLREVMKDNYLPFTGEEAEGTPGSPSAEFWCHTDVLNYDNLEYIDVEAGGEYYCVAFNVEEVVEPDMDTLNVCKIDTEGNPVSDWKMTMSLVEPVYKYASPDLNGLPNGKELLPRMPETQTGFTSKDGCVTFEVPAGSGTWIVTEAMQEGWEFVEVQSTGFNTTHSNKGEYCMLNEEREVKRELSIRTVVFEEDTCTFTNREPAPAEEETPERTGPRTFQSGNAANAQAVGRVAGIATTAEPEVLGEAVSACGPLLNSYMRASLANTPFEVYRLQAFLIASGYEGVELTGEFDTATDRAVREFQATHRADILQPWYDRGLMSHTNPTGYVYMTTRWMINNLYCPGSEDMPELR